jgi:hypothetical protein
MNILILWQRINRWGYKVWRNRQEKTSSEYRFNRFYDSRWAWLYVYGQIIIPSLAEGLLYSVKCVDRNIGQSSLMAENRWLISPYLAHSAIVIPIIICCSSGSEIFLHRNKHSFSVNFAGVYDSRWAWRCLIILSSRHRRIVFLELALVRR